MTASGQVNAETAWLGFMLGQVDAASSNSEVDKQRLTDMLVALDKDASDVVEAACNLQGITRDMIANAARNAGIEWPARASRKES